VIGRGRKKTQKIKKQSKVGGVGVGGGDTSRETKQTNETKKRTTTPKQKTKNTKKKKKKTKKKNQPKQTRKNRLWNKH